MAIDVSRPVEAPADAAVVEVPDAPERPPREQPPGPTEPAREEVAPTARPSRVLLAAVLATAAAAWVAGGAFDGWMARPVALAGAIVGVGGVALAVRSGRPVLQYLVVPAAFVLGYLAALILPNDTEVTGTVPELVRQAITNGGLSEPPVPFDPGWRFIIGALLALLGAAAGSLAVSLQRPKVALLVPLPLLLAGALNQPEGAEMLSGGVAVVLMVAGLMVAYGAELAGEADTSRRYEVRQLVRGAGGIGVALLVLALLSQASLLFPEPPSDQEAEPQKPQVVPLDEVEDRPLFEVESELRGPWRLGVLDEYDGSDWLLPPFDLDRLVDPGPDGSVDGPDRPTVPATFTVRELGGFTLAAPANPVAVEGAGGNVGFDPRTQVFRVRRGSPGQGYTYTAHAAEPPSGPELAAAVGTVPPDVARFASAPDPPLAVVDLLSGAPTNPWERLQFVRGRLYESVTAAGSGVPVSVNPARVVELLRGGKGTPFEIVAAEALLARWAGVPARIGYGFNGGEPLDGGVLEFRPRHGANWLEVWFPDYGWVPVVGVPPKAEASLGADEKNAQPEIRPSDELSLQLYLPVQNPNPLLFFQVVRYWLSAAVPVLAAVAGLVVAFPWLLKLWRSRRRRLWASAHGPAGRVAVAYAQFRDLAVDLDVGDPAATPLAFLDHVVEDDEHAELAWLVTRALYGDLARDLHDDDAEAAEAMSVSLRRRMARAQSGGTRLSAAVSRESLRHPYDPGLPNPWPRPRTRRHRVRPLTLLGAARRLLPGARPA